MSVSSGSSLCGDGDQDLLLDEEEEIDFYAVLNVPKDATDDEINKAYRKRCLIFHPDRHTEESDKQDAEKIFVKLRRAHEVLMDPKTRAIYDALGVRGIDAQGWELVSRSANPENIRKEYEFLQRLKDQELMLQRIHPSTGFVVKTNLSGLFQENPEERYGPQFTGVAITQSVECNLTNTDRVGLVGRVKAGNGRGDGSVTCQWKKSAGQYNIDNTATFSADALAVSCRISRNIFTRAAIIIQPQLQYLFLQEALVPSISFIYSMRLRMQWQGSIVLSLSPVQSGVTTTLVHTQNNQPKVVTNFTLSPTNSNIRMVYYRREIDRDAFTEMGVQVSMYGVSPSVHLERKLSRYSRVGVALHFSFPTCLLIGKFKLKTGQSSYEWQIVLCDDKDSLYRSAFYGVAIPYMGVTLFRLFCRGWCERISGLFEDTSHDNQVDLIKQEESVRVINLMRPTAERIKNEEEQKHGIVIVDARYGQSDTNGSRSYPIVGERTIDVTVAIQSMVNDSQLRIYSVKSQLPGFYDPCPGETKILHVQYTFRDEMHAVTVPDDMPLHIPLKAHRVSTVKTTPEN